VANGSGALLLNTTGIENTACGADALINNTTANANTAVGFRALHENTTGLENTANGAFALFSNTGGDVNTAIGVDALSNNTTGSDNTATGFFALLSNTTGVQNTAIGESALKSATTAVGNTAVGFNALLHDTTGFGNVAVGYDAGMNVTTASGVICIGTNGANVSSGCFIGNIRAAETANNDAIPVLIDSAGQLGTISSSRRYKREIKPMNKASEVILALKPATFHYKSDKTNRPEFGLIAEQVAEINPDLVVRDENGEIYTVRYDAVNAMLLNEFLKEYRKVELQDRKAQTQQKEIDALKAELREQKSLIQKVSAQIEMSNGAPKVVLNKP
jgi:hypothetical protein